MFVDYLIIIIISASYLLKEKKRWISLKLVFVFVFSWTMCVYVFSFWIYFMFPSNVNFFLSLFSIHSIFKPFGFFFFVFTKPQQLLIWYTMQLEHICLITFCSVFFQLLFLYFSSLLFLLKILSKWINKQRITLCVPIRQLLTQLRLKK